jgi:hypothetical protein
MQSTCNGTADLQQGEAGRKAVSKEDLHFAWNKVAQIEQR